MTPPAPGDRVSRLASMRKLVGTEILEAPRLLTKMAKALADMRLRRVR